MQHLLSTTHQWSPVRRKPSSLYEHVYKASKHQSLAKSTGFEGIERHELNLEDSRCNLDMRENLIKLQDYLEKLGNHFKPPRPSHTNTCWFDVVITNLTFSVTSETNCQHRRPQVYLPAAELRGGCAPSACSAAPATASHHPRLWLGTPG